MPNTVKYVAGLLFDTDAQRVALVEKKHGPAVLLGKWNAIGGRIIPGEPGLPDESSTAAIYREFHEEAGVYVRWTLFLELIGVGWSVDFYHAFSTQQLANVKTCEDEIIKVWPLLDLPEIVPNLRWIIPMALGHEDDHVWVYAVREKETFSPAARSTAE